jgi:hypothetical protein
MSASSQILERLRRDGPHVVHHRAASADRARRARAHVGDAPTAHAEDDHVEILADAERLPAHFPLIPVRLEVPAFVLLRAPSTS